MTEARIPLQQCLRADETPTREQMARAVDQYCSWINRDAPEKIDHCTIQWNNIARRSADCSTHQKCPPLQYALPLCPGQPELRGRLR